MKKVKALNTVIYVFVMIALATTGVVVLLVNYKLFKESPLLWTADGFINYLKAYGDFKDLFVVTIAATAAYVGLQSLQQTVQANKEKLKQDRFSEWKSRVESRILEVEKNDPYLRRVFLERRMKYFDALFARDFYIASGPEMAICMSIFGDVIPFPEAQNNRTIRLGGVYASSDHAYSYDAFRFVFIGAADGAYPEVERDLHALYLNLLPDRQVVDQETYKQAQINAFPSIA
jgi:HPt (histidine-containing phosphotransfer) domain-containing protein